MSSRPRILDHVAALGHAVFEKGAYNLNIIAVRKRGGVVDRFDDLLHVVAKDGDGRWFDDVWPITTDPGIASLTDPARHPDGTAQLKTGQYRGAYELGLHKGKPALVARGAMPVRRDDDGDAVLDPDRDGSAWGINVHRAGKSSTTVGRWSAGCMVFAQEDAFLEFLDLCALQVKHNPTWRTFTLTLVDEPEDL
jgi:hypothetical protein